MRRRTVTWGERRVHGQSARSVDLPPPHIVADPGPGGADGGILRRKETYGFGGDERPAERATACAARWFGGRHRADSGSPLRR